jgi:hypothetical protein
MMTIYDRVTEHYEESLEHFSSNQIVGCFLQGSQNYNLDLPSSDVDTKLIVVPSFKDIALNRKPVSTVHIRENEEHIDFKDIRLYIEIFHKQNVNFVEILFTPYSCVNDIYSEEWRRLVEARERIARMNPWRAVKAMKGVALDKYHAMEREYPSKMEILAKYGYDAKQLHHLVRIDYFLTQYIAGADYGTAMVPTGSMRDFLMSIKTNEWDLTAARNLAEVSFNHIEELSTWFCNKTEDKEDPEMRDLLEDVSYNIMKIAVKNELENI